MTYLDRADSCQAVLAHCCCALPKNHEQRNHHCTCGGQWTGSDTDGDAVAKRLPRSGTSYSESIYDLLDAMFGDPE